METLWEEATRCREGSPRPKNLLFRNPRVFRHLWYLTLIIILLSDSILVFFPGGVLGQRALEHGASCKTRGRPIDARPQLGQHYGFRNTLQMKYQQVLYSIFQVEHLVHQLNNPGVNHRQRDLLLSVLKLRSLGPRAGLPHGLPPNHQQGVPNHGQHAHQQATGNHGGLPPPLAPQMARVSPVPQQPDPLMLLAQVSFPFQDVLIVDCYVLIVPPTSAGRTRPSFQGFTSHVSSFWPPQRFPGTSGEYHADFFCSYRCFSGNVVICFIRTRPPGYQALRR